MRDSLLQQSLEHVIEYIEKVIEVPEDLMARTAKVVYRREYSRRSTKQAQTIPKQVSRTQFRAACRSSTVLIAEAVVQVPRVDKQDVDEFGTELIDVLKNDDLRCCVQTARRR